MERWNAIHTRFSGKGSYYSSMESLSYGIPCFLNNSCCQLSTASSNRLDLLVIPFASIWSTSSLLPWTWRQRKLVLHPAWQATVIRVFPSYMIDTFGGVLFSFTETSCRDVLCKRDLSGKPNDAPNTQSNRDACATTPPRACVLLCQTRNLKKKKNKPGNECGLLGGVVGISCRSQTSVFAVPLVLRAVSLNFLEYPLSMQESDSSHFKTFRMRRRRQHGQNRISTDLQVNSGRRGGTAVPGSGRDSGDGRRFPEDRGDGGCSSHLLAISALSRDS